MAVFPAVNQAHAGSLLNSEFLGANLYHPLLLSNVVNAITFSQVLLFCGHGQDSRLLVQITR